MRLIDADALAKSLEKEREYLINRGLVGAENVICHHALPLVEKAPTIDTEQKHQLSGETSTLDTCPYYHHEPTGEPFCEMEDRRHGKWTLKMNERFYWKECSMCGHKPPRSDEYGTYIESNYCPYCGAKMDGGGDAE